ncbi:MAG: hypothetical protein IKG86_00660 [Paludibacteraceae bacterium]|nr:hypothetical protein [Paludibacteraceae bacterium]
MDYQLPICEFDVEQFATSSKRGNITIALSINHKDHTENVVIGELDSLIYAFGGYPERYARDIYCADTRRAGSFVVDVLQCQSRREVFKIKKWLSDFLGLKAYSKDDSMELYRSKEAEFIDALKSLYAQENIAAKYLALKSWQLYHILAGDCAPSLYGQAYFPIDFSPENGHQSAIIQALLSPYEGRTLLYHLLKWDEDFHELEKYNWMHEHKTNDSRYDSFSLDSYAYPARFFYRAGSPYETYLCADFSCWSLVIHTLRHEYANKECLSICPICNKISISTSRKRYCSARCEELGKQKNFANYSSEDADYPYVKKLKKIAHNARERMRTLSVSPKYAILHSDNETDTQIGELLESSRKEIAVELKNAKKCIKESTPKSYNSIDEATAQKKQQEIVSSFDSFCTRIQADFRAKLDEKLNFYMNTP